MKLRVFIAASALLLVGLSASAQTNSSGQSPASLYKEGFRLFSSYNGHTQERLEGYELMVRAAESGYLPAKLSIARYEAGFLTTSQPEGSKSFLKPNLPRALRYLREGSDAGVIEAKQELALLYSSGVGKPRHDGETPHQLLLAAAAAGSAEAMILLSQRYLYGHGAVADLLEAGKWHYRGAKEDAYRLRQLIDEGGDPKPQRHPLLAELAETVSLFAKAERQNPKAAAELAFRFAEAGRPAEAVALYRLAAQRGEGSAREALTNLEGKLSPAERAMSVTALRDLFGEDPRSR